MKSKTKKFASGGLNDLASLALVGGLGYMFGRGSKSKAEKEKAVVADAIKAAAPEKKEPEPKRGFGPSDIGFTGDGKDADTTQTKPAPVDKAPVKTTPKKAAPITKKAAPITKEAPAASESSNTTPPTYYTPKPKKAEPVSKPYPQAEATAKLKKAEAERRSGQGLTPHEEYKGIGSRRHIEGLRLERSQKLEEEAKEQLEKNKRENQPRQVFKSGGIVKSSASKRADGIAQRGKTRGRVM